MTSGELATRLGVSDQTIRAWSKEFGAWLSEGARVEGQTRRFEEHDQAVLATVAGLRAGGLGYEEIKQELASGHLEELPPAPEPTTGTGLTVAQLTALVGEQRGELAALREERAYLRDKLDRTEAENRELIARAAAVEARLALLEELRKEGRGTDSPPRTAPATSDPPAPQREEKRRPWWKVWG